MTRMTLLLTSAVSVSLLCFSPQTQAQRHVFIPGSSLPQANNASGQAMAHTHLRILVPSATQMNFGKAATQPNELPPFPGFFFETPASIACIYQLAEPSVRGCNPNVTTANPSGGGRAIALVDAFDDPSAVADIAEFSAQFGLPPADLTVVFAQGTEPGIDPTGGWETEEALDTQWAHAMAPGAKIFLVEAATSSLNNLFAAVQVASKLVAAAGGGEVSMSWGAGEFSSETAEDALFTTPGIVYFASTGDTPGVEYPSASPNVVAAGGTTISRNSTTGNFILENTWQDAGGGPSQVEPRPAFQRDVAYIVGGTRGTPDLSFDANPNTGVWVFNDNPVLGDGWFIVGGTSVAAPSLAGITNAAGHFSKSSAVENSALYSGQQRRFNDIVFGDCGLNISDFALPGYDFCTGNGSVNGGKGNRHF